MLFLRKLGFDVVEAENGLSALETLDAHEAAPFDVVFMDVQMPELDGVETTARIRAKAGPHQQIPVIAMTAYAMKGDRERFLAAGMNGYVAKPIEPADLARAVAEVLCFPPGAPG